MKNSKNLLIVSILTLSFLATGAQGMEDKTGLKDLSPDLLKEIGKDMHPDDLARLSGLARRFKNVHLPMAKVQKLSYEQWENRVKKYFDRSEGQNLNLEKCPVVVDSTVINDIVSLLGLRRVGAGGEIAQVNYITLSGDKLKEVPAEVFKFRDLKAIDLSETGLTKIPENIRRLEFLEYFFCGGNKLDSFPEEILACKSLTTIDLGENKIKSFPWDKLEELPNLKYLYVADNPLLARFTRKELSQKKNELFDRDNDGLYLLTSLEEGELLMKLRHIPYVD